MANELNPERAIEKSHPVQSVKPYETALWLWAK